MHMKNFFGALYLPQLFYIVEEYCRGYPRLAAFMSIDANFLMVKRFDVLHMRYLLFLQDTMTELQERLDACDDAEDVQLHNSSRRQDGNETRKTLMRELEISLTKYGGMT